VTDAMRDQLDQESCEQPIWAGRNGHNDRCGKAAPLHCSGSGCESPLCHVHAETCDHCRAILCAGCREIHVCPRANGRPPQVEGEAGQQPAADFTRRRVRPLTQQQAKFAAKGVVTRLALLFQANADRSFTGEQVVEILLAAVMAIDQATNQTDAETLLNRELSQRASA